MASVYFSDSLGTLRKIGDAAQWPDCMKIIMDFLAEHNYHSYYQRLYSTKKNCIIVDVGSHTEHFEVWGMKIEEVINNG